MRAKVKSLKVRNQVDSNHQPIIMHVKGKEKRKGMAGKKRIEKKEKVWDWKKNKKVQRKNKKSRAEKNEYRREARRTERGCKRLRIKIGKRG